MESLPLMELSSLVKDIHAKTREASQNTDLDMRGFLRIGKTLQIIQSELEKTPPPPNPSKKKQQKKQQQKKNKNKNKTKNKRNLKQQRLMNASKKGAKS